jgi:hypothetical protein
LLFSLLDFLLRALKSNEAVAPEMLASKGMNYFTSAAGNSPFLVGELGSPYLIAGFGR